MRPNNNIIYNNPSFRGPDEIEGKFEDQTVTIGTHTLIKPTKTGRGTIWTNSANKSRKSGTQSSIYVPISSSDTNHNSAIPKSLWSIHPPHKD